jgi:cytochrome c peroxidase
MIRSQTLILFGLSLVLSLVMATSAQAKKPPPPPPPGDLTQQEELGEYLFKDTNLSEPAGQSCESCHDPDFGFADPDTATAPALPIPVSQGANSSPITRLFGSRNSPSAGYAAFIPTFTTKRGIQGGQFWDGRASDLAAQARGPFLNPVEMNNTNEGQVIGKIETSDFEDGYADLFNQVCGPNAFATENIDASYICLSEAIAAYESTEVFSPFTSKFDAEQAGDYSFTPQEQRGWELFTGNAKCGHCHTVKVGSGNPVLFTDHKYHNLGLPENLEIRQIYFFPDYELDLGLGGFLNDPQQYGKFKDPHLRNIELTPPYMHNGVLKTLKEVVHFYNTRDVLPVCDDGNLDEDFGEICWAAPEIPDTMDSSFMGDLNLTDAEEDAIVAFMLTLTDGYTP